MKLFKLLVVAVLSFAVVACATGGTAKSPEQLVFQLKSDYNVALTVAVAYKGLPSCDQPGAPVLCAKPSVVKQLQQADNVAFPALQAAETTVRNPCPVGSPPTCDPASKMQLALTGATQAIGALSSITATLATK